MLLGPAVFGTNKTGESHAEVEAILDTDALLSFKPEETSETAMLDTSLKLPTGSPLRT